MSLILCSLTFATGRGATAEALAASIASVRGARILERDEEEGRLALRVALDSSQAPAATFAAIQQARERIDLRQLPAGGRRPLGAVETVQFVPLSDGTLEGCVALAHGLGRRVGRELAIPVYYFGFAALRPERRDLDRACRGEQDPRTLLGKSAVERQPDEGPPDDAREGHPSAGATAIGARRSEVAFEVELDTRDAELARELAARLAGPEGRLPGVDARGAVTGGSGRGLVVLGLRDVAQVGLVRAYEELERLARERGVELLGSRLPGLVPRAALPPGTLERTRLRGFDPSTQVLEELCGR